LVLEVKRLAAKPPAFSPPHNKELVIPSEARKLPLQEWWPFRAKRGNSSKKKEFMMYKKE